MTVCIRCWRIWDLQREISWSHLWAVSYTHLDQVVESWTSTEEAHYIEKLPIGKYTLREEQAPKGYLLTADVTFEVKDTGEIQKVAMKDDTAKGKVILNKADKSSGEPLKGVE